jgi:colanic acid biosynthesis glycosyl transferase WcaI
MGIFRRSQNITNDTFLLAYSGNLGVKQGLDVLFDTAKLLENHPIHIIICGDGAERVRLENKLHSSHISNITMLPLLPKQQYFELLVDAHICLITQQSGSGASFFPSKLLNTLAFNKPVISVADDDSDLAKTVHQYEFGINIQPGKPEDFASKIKILVHQPKLLKSWGLNGRKFVEQFAMHKVLSDFQQELIDLRREFDLERVFKSKMSASFSSEKNPSLS